MLLKEIRLVDVDIFENNKKVFSGKIEDAYPKYRRLRNKRSSFFRWEITDYSIIKEIIHNMETVNKNDISNFHIPRWDELPEIDLYLDQIVTLLESYLQNYIGKSEEKIITKTMINNYIKAGLIKAPIKKKYTKTHIATLFVICTLKQIYSINDINKLIRLAKKTASIKKAYDDFCTALEKATALTFAKKEYKDAENITTAEYLLKNVCQSFANKLYVERTFLHKDN